MTLLYAAFAAVALWLLGELLLQRRAPLPWRALALAGFLALVGGVAMGSLPLIALGVLGFGAGQALATRGLKAGGGPYWSLVAPERVPVVGRLFGAEAAGPVAPAEPEPVVVGEVSAVEAVEAVEATAVFQAEEYRVEGDSVYYGYAEQEQQQAAYYGYAAEQQVAYADPQAAQAQAQVPMQGQPQEYAYAEYYGQYQGYAPQQAADYQYQAPYQDTSYQDTSYQGPAYQEPSYQTEYPYDPYAQAPYHYPEQQPQQ